MPFKPAELNSAVKCRALGEESVLAIPVRPGVHQATAQN
jgi:hypothetical protein